MAIRLIWSVARNGRGILSRGMENERRNFLNKLVNIEGAKGLEIGALTSPLVTSKELGVSGEIFYLDHLSTEDLKLKYAADETVNCEKIVSVDFVCPDGDLKNYVEGNTFDYIIASHVIEHSPNLIKFLRGVLEILNPRGILFLVVPDKRFTFDVNRPETTFGQILEAYLSAQLKPSVSSVYDHLSSAVSVDAGKIWQEPIDTYNAPKLASLDFAWETASTLRESGKYIDVHVNIFTPYSFLEILKKIILHGLCSFHFEGFKDTQVGHLDFIVALSKSSSCCVEISTTNDLTNFPQITLESKLSPYMPQIRSMSKSLERLTKIIQKQERALDELKSITDCDRVMISQLKENLDTAQRTLNRRSIKFTLTFLHFFYSLFRISKKG